MKLARVLVLLVPLLLTACGLSEQQKADYAQVQRSGVTPAVYDKMVHQDDLSLYDIKALAKAGVSSGVILRYLRDRQTIYTLNSEDVANLRRAGVSQSIVDYMLQSPRLYSPGFYPTIGIGVGYGPYWGDPFWGPPYPYYPYRYNRWR